MARKPKPLLDEVRFFVKFHLGKDAFAPHTGTDHAAWCAFVHLMQLWTIGGRDHAIAAMVETIHAAQKTEAVLSTFVQAIPAVADWTTVRELWPRIVGGGYGGGYGQPEIVLYGGLEARHLRACEKHLIRDANDKVIEHRVTLWGGP